MTEGNGEVRELPDSIRQGELPSNWIICLLDDLLERISNGASVTQYDGKVGFPITRIETIWNEEIDSSRVKYIYESDEKFISKYALKYGDILLSHINSDSHLGKTALYKDQPRILVHGINLLLLRANELILPEYLNYQLKYLRVKGAFIKVAQRAVNQSSINQNKLKSFLIKLCSLNEQQRIVTRIEELFSELEQGIENLKKAQKQLKVYRQAVLKWAFEGKLTEKWRSQIQQKKLDIQTGEELLAQIKAERKNRYQQQLLEWEEAVREWKAIGKLGKKPTKPQKSREMPPLSEEVIAELPETPDGWCWGCSGELFVFVTSGSRGWAQYYSDSGAIFLRITNLDFNSLNLDLSPETIQYVNLPTEAEGMRSKALVS